MTSSSKEYDQVHALLRKNRGPAKLHQCVWSGVTAEEWAFAHTDPNPLVDPNGLLYSLNLNHYEPMTRWVHRTFDALMRRGASPEEIADAARKAWERELDVKREIHRKQREEARGHWLAWVSKAPSLKTVEIRRVRVM